jgi:hypothetical protein
MRGSRNRKNQSKKIKNNSPQEAIEFYLKNILKKAAE